VDRLSGGIGYCGAGSGIRVARAALHHWEEPCISGERGSGTVFFSFCNMKCIYCQNYEISHNGAGLEIGTERLAEIFLELEGAGAHNINLVTPTHYAPQIRQALILAKEKGLKLPILYNCSGYEGEGLKLLEGLVDIYLPDVKYWTKEEGEELSDAPDYFEEAMAAVDEMIRQVGSPVFDPKGIMQKGVMVRHLLLPGGLDSAKRITEHLFRKYGNQIFYSFMSQYTPDAPGVSRETIEGYLRQGKERSERGESGPRKASKSDLQSLDKDDLREDNLREDDLREDDLRRIAGVLRLDQRVSESDYEEWIDFALELGIENGFTQEGGSASESFIPAFDGEGVRKDIDK